MKTENVILQLIYPGVIDAFAETGKISLREALDKFYKSQIYIEMSNGISDMHCRSEKYLAEELIQEWKLKRKD